VTCLCILSLSGGGRKRKGGEKGEEYGSPGPGCDPNRSRVDVIDFFAEDRGQEGGGESVSPSVASFRSKVCLPPSSLVRGGEWLGGLRCLSLIKERNTGRHRNTPRLL